MIFLERLKARLGRLPRWQRWLAAFLLGALMAAAQAPLYLWPLIFVSVPLVLLLDGGEGRGWRSFFTFYFFAYGYAVAGLYWIGISFFVDAEKFALLLPLPVLGLPAVVAFFPAAGVFAARLLAGVYSGRPALAVFALLLPAGWALGDWVKGWVFTGMPWNLIGYAWADTAPAMQIASVIGSHGLSLITLLAAAALALPLLEWNRRHLTLAAVLPLGLALAVAGGAARLEKAQTEFMPDIWLRLVQPSVPQTLKWKDELRQQHLMAHVDLTRAPGEHPPTHVIWPEAAIPYLLDEEPKLLQGLGGLLPPGAQLIVGAPRREFRGPGRALTDMTLFNSVFVVDDKGRLVGRYDKIHLVPFGEYLPFRPILQAFGLDALAAGQVDYSPGHDPEPLILPGDIPLVRVLVCFEAIFPGEVMAHGPPYAALLLNLTNDAWFGRSSGPYQHFASARMRSVEFGVPMVRSANNGVSAIIDGYGRIIASLGLDAVGFVEGPLPLPIVGPSTAYSRFGDGITLLLIAFSFGLARLSWHRTRNG